jgi:glycosyltransferase involved in cell wall biosynthesis
MKILHVVGGSLSGGAARGAYWLHQGLLDLSVDSRVLCNSNETYGDSTVTTIAGNKLGKLKALLRGQADPALQAVYRNRQRVIFSTGLVGFDFTRTKEYREADVIHLHWICGGMVNMRHLAKVDKPIVWTMRDMWPMTGGCHYSMECEQYKTGCGQCPQLGSQESRDLSRWVWKRKRKYIPTQAKLVGISHWLSDCARQSALFGDFDVRTIHNNVSIKEFFPVEKYLARQMLGIAADRPVVLAGAQGLESFYKGFDLYLQAIQQLGSETRFVFFGKLDKQAVESLGCDYVNMGFLYDTVSLRLVYSAADVFVGPSKMDAFGKTLAEAMACGTPVVCFDATGPKDIVDHKVNGYKAKPFDPEDLVHGIEFCLHHPEPEQLRKEARAKVGNFFSAPVVATQYIELYKSLLNDAV